MWNWWWFWLNFLFLDCIFILFVFWCVATLFIQDVCFQHKSLPADALCVLFYSFFFLYCSPFLRFFIFEGRECVSFSRFRCKYPFSLSALVRQKTNFFSVFIDRRWKKQIKKKHLKTKERNQNVMIVIVIRFLSFFIEFIRKKLV